MGKGARLRERWRDPCKPNDWWVDTEHVQITHDGRIQQMTVFQFSTKNMNRIRQGYVCAHCFDPKEQAFPERCSTCGFPMRAEQSAYIAKMYRGNVRDGGEAAAEEDQRARIDEARQRWALEAEGLTMKGSILVPRGINAS